MNNMENVYLWTVLAPLIGAIIAGLFGKRVGRAGAHWVTIIGVAVAFVLSAITFKHMVIDGAEVYNASVYTWMVSEGIRFEIGFLIDNLTAMMMVVVTFVSLMVHIYTVGYMHEDPGYQRFFSYISLFTFSMLMLVMANNFLQLFFGWEAVGLVSYLLIGFWYTRDTAIYANLKAFLVNRVGDFGFLLGIAAVLMYFGSLDYATVFGQVEQVDGQTITLFGDNAWSVITVICILLFIGAMGKSAQVPLHVWLPDSMEGPTPISALIHAATMVTAGIFMVARMSPLFEFSETALTVVLVIGAITALFMGFLGLVQNDIKRVVAYSTLSQLGYMTVALGASAYAAGIFHLMTHAFFKALLFLAAGSVIIAMHHEQDMRKMGGLRKYMPITWITSLIGSLALIGTPLFAGFYSKDSIIEAVAHSQIAGSGFAYFAVLTGVFVTALYSFRMYFLVFHGKERMDEHTRSHLHETPPVVTIPLILLAIPSVIIGAIFMGDMIAGDFFREAIFVLPEHDALGEWAADFHGWWAMALHAFVTWPFWLAAAGVFTAWFLYMKRPEIPGRIQARFQWLHTLLDNKYYADRFNEIVFAGGGRQLGQKLWRIGDVKLIDGLAVNGSAALVGWFAGRIRHIQTGYLFHYAFAMIIGVVVLLGLFVFLNQ
ncbi:NADH-quinone oxidoreductase subunit L [Thiohalophilus thiocyanatoxydans]|uniref:NADH-quinone oxidoreductase subunit L n=1 Tax=Thiohalophilus thiocyanatoxydans TaxID=381308 RepID=A0A4R8IYI2_9GAMM|nr:NADH-quinone oxidoreductase subunit L [Thiohalophilus thiocyanatoxydans]TDY02493.1 NADH-quinone oxidoreductase subunit L [Thiohalophilus thiocyanatoxydans]